MDPTSTSRPPAAVPPTAAALPAAGAAPAPAGGPVRRRWRPPVLSLGVMLALCMVLITLWGAGVTYYFFNTGIERSLVAEDRQRAQRAAQTLQATLERELGALRRRARLLAEGATLRRALLSRNAATLTGWTEIAADASAGELIEVVDHDGRWLSPRRGSDALALPWPPAERGLITEAVDGRLLLRVIEPVSAGAPEAFLAGGLVLTRWLDAGFLQGSGGGLDDDLVLADGHGVLLSRAGWSQSLDATGLMQAMAAQAPRSATLDDGREALLVPIEAAGERLIAVAVLPDPQRRQAMVSQRQQLLLASLLTMFAALAFGLWMRRVLVRPILKLTERAESLSRRYAGRTEVHHGNEFDVLVTAFDTMTEALLAHSARLKRAHLTERQNRRELQRQYALMRLLRGLAAAANESDSVEQALERAVAEIGEYLSWPIGRAVLLVEADDGFDAAPQPPAQSFWSLHDAERYAPFVEASERLGARSDVVELTDGAYRSGMPHWVNDLSQLAGFGRRDVALSCGLVSGVVIPVVARGHITALVEFFSLVRVEANAEMLELVEAIGVELSRVAERHRAERDLRASEAYASRLALIASRTEKAVVLLAPVTGRVQWVNEAFTRSTGVALEQARGRILNRLVRGLEDKRRVIAAVAQAVERGVACQLEVVVYSAQGTRSIHEIEGRPLHDESGRFVQYALLATDISRLKDAEAALRASENFFRVLFDSSPVPAAIQSSQYKLVRVNGAYAQLLGCEAGMLIGADPVQFTHPEDRPATVAARDRLPSPGAGVEFERRWIRVDGRALRVRVHLAALNDARQDRLYLTVVEDVTDIRASEERAREARDAAEAASRAKSQFLANMSHEIRTPMNGVLGMTELLLGTQLNDKQRRFAEAVYRSGESLLSIINDILDFSKIEAGKLELELADFDLRTLVEDVFELLAARAAEKQVELAYRIGTEVPEVVQGDPVRLRQILTNLVGNAIKFTERGEVVVQVDARALERAAAGAGEGAPAAGGRYRLDFAVRDTGIGISAEALGRLFTSFMQADQSMSRRYGGTGLGLAISRQLVELMGGSISAESRVGIGSVFRFDVVLNGGAAAALRSPAPLQTLQGRRVIVVEDNPTNRSILQAQLLRLGMDVAVAEQGVQALELMRAAARAGQRFDAALIDMKMPVMDGLTLAAAIRRDPALRDMVLMMLTSLAGSNEARQAQACGIDIYLAKPVRQQELINALTGAMAEPQAAVQPANPRVGTGLRVLLVEDNPVNQEVARVMLEDLGAAVGVAANGRHALEMLAQQVFDLVLMDCQMPEMDGFEALQRLRDPAATPQLATRRDVPVVALTANALAGDAERCLAAGFDDYFAKPVKQGQLAAALLRLCPRPARTPAAPPAAPVADEGAAAVLDPGVLDRIRDMERRGAARLLARLIDTYLDSAGKLVAAAEQGLADGDAAALRQAVHTLKSSSANLGATDLAGRCADLEALARAGDIGLARAGWGAARAEYERVVRALRRLDGAAPAADAARPGAVADAGGAR